MVLGMRCSVRGDAGNRGGELLGGKARRKAFGGHQDQECRPGESGLTLRSHDHDAIGIDKARPQGPIQSFAIAANPAFDAKFLPVASCGVNVVTLGRERRKNQPQRFAAAP